MSGIYDWSGSSQPPIPTWWLRLVLPMMDREVGGLSHGQIAHQANVLAGRSRQLWDHTSISRFKTHENMRPVALVHALSGVFNVPSPFVIAHSEAQALAMAAIAHTMPAQEPGPQDPGRQRRLEKLDAAVEQLMPRGKRAKSVLDASAIDAVSSRVYGETSAPQTRRADRPRPRRA